MNSAHDHDRAELDLFLDGELDADTPRRDAVAQHLAACPACTLHAAERIVLKRHLRSSGTRYSPSPALRNAVRKQIAPRPHSPRWYSLASLAAVACVLLFAFFYLHRDQRSLTLSEVADLHVSALASANPLDVVSTDRHTVKPWFAGRIPFTFNLPEFAGTDFTLLGGRMVYLHQQPGAQLIVAHGQHRISVLVFTAGTAIDDRLPGSPTLHPQNTFSIETWRTSSLRFFIAGDVEPASIEALGRALQSANP